MLVHDWIEAAFDGKPIPRSPSVVQYIVVHRLGLSLGDKPEDIIKAFKDTSPFAAGSYTGGQTAYSIWIDPDGVGFQFLPITDVGMHSRRWNWPAIGVAVAGDFRDHAPELEQMQTLETICTALALFIGPKYRLVGHDELPNSSRDKGKHCPGEHLSMNKLRFMVGAKLHEIPELDDKTKALVLALCGIKM